MEDRLNRNSLHKKSETLRLDIRCGRSGEAFDTPPCALPFDPKAG
jgi:hypothetical protein